jgi:hypothetical protein
LWAIEPVDVFLQRSVVSDPSASTGRATVSYLMPPPPLYSSTCFSAVPTVTLGVVSCAIRVPLERRRTLCHAAAAIVEKKIQLGSSKEGNVLNPGTRRMTHLELIAIDTNTIVATVVSLS